MLNKQAQFARVKTLIFDIDGVFTDGRVHLLSSGEQFRTFDIKDTYGVEQALKAGLRVGIVSSANADGIRKWLDIIGRQFQNGLFLTSHRNGQVRYIE